MRPKLTQMQATLRLREAGYGLVSHYARKDRHVELVCRSHRYLGTALPANIWKGGKLPCCDREAKAERMRSSVGPANPFYGKRHTEELRERMSRKMREAPHGLRGKPRPEYLTRALLASITGVPRPATVRTKVSAGVGRRHRSFPYCYRKAANGKTAGKRGYFYIARIGSELKFGSATTSIGYRLARLRQRHGPNTDLLMCAVVPDAGAYEAAMMQRYKSEWLHGERFRDFCSPLDDSTL